MTGVLAGIKIIEISGIGPGPFCGMLLADLGADVIAIERPAADLGKARPQQIYHRGKQSIVLDLKAPEAVEVVLDLLSDADALIEGMRPGVMERLGLGPDICLERNPALVYGRMTGWGQSGPMAQAAGHDSNYTALSGALWYAGASGSAPQAPSTVLGDIAGGALYLALGILAAILRARSGGQGQVVDAAIVDGSAHLLNLLLSMIASTGGNFARDVQIFDSSHWAGQSYCCSDGGWINIAPLEPQFYAELIERLGLQGDERFTRGQFDPSLWPELRDEFTKLFASQPRAHWQSLLEGTDSCFAPVLAPDEAAEHPHMAHRNIYQRVDDILQTKAAPEFSSDANPAPQAIPPRGSDWQQVLTNAGFSVERIQSLISNDIVSTK
ncbi:CaiB/BaiF CoA-transferase family protein [uncultured Parasphingorhabdus sp.]|uniref:CaiB/BaiF CoA transferase family protein n=1 Tax=uncultured Parasphingorhabdus sp. TaxID=2709694 RepID=UPI002AA83D34|nr:CaiB/BaiF CoA-transferase family protein [uncultured Parasphingorhabdus sp.]